MAVSAHDTSLDSTGSSCDMENSFDDDKSNPEPPLVVSKFELIDKLGSGSFGDVSKQPIKVSNELTQMHSGVSTQLLL